MFNYKWFIKDGYPVKGIIKHGKKVFSTFACGGGSTMGYKLAGYDVIGANDIDPQMQMVYIKNHNPKYYFLCPIGELINGGKELPGELYNLDVLDGSPPCSTFSMAGSREDGWKKKKKFREGQAEQILSDLFFDFISLTKELQPKVFIAENVKGMLLGNAKAYTKQVIQAFEDAGYNTQLFLLNSASMGVPQRRERVFFIGSRKDLNLPKIKLDFNDRGIPFREVETICSNTLGKEITEAFARWWRLTPIGGSLSHAHPKGSFFNSVKISPDKVLTTITATGGAKLIHYKYPNELSNEALTLCGSFPLDYNFMDIDPKYLIGMSVPPLMMARIADEVYKQLLK